MKLGQFVLFVLMLWASAFALAAPTASATKIKAGDVLAVSCIEEALLDKEYTVNPDGLLVLPFVGAIEVEGKDEIQAATAISAALIDQRILRRATVTVKVVKPGKEPEEVPPLKPVVNIRISGAVKKIVDLPFAEGLRLSDLIRLAEPTPMADLSRVSITPLAGEAKTVKYQDDAAASLDFNPYLKPGDKIVIPVRMRPMEVFVLGGVKQPGLQPYSEGMSLQEAIEAAGGLDNLGDMARIRVEREGVGPTVYDLTGNSGKVLLEPGDRVVVELSSARRYLIVLGNVARPGPVEYRDGMTLTQALADAGGLVRASGTEKVAIFNAEDPTMKKAVTYNIDRIMQGLSGDVPLKPGDRVEAMHTGQRNPKGFLLFTVATILIFLMGR